MKKLFLIIGIGCISNSFFAQTKDSVAGISLSMQQAIEYATKNQNNIKNAQIDQELAHQKVREITGLGLPQINASFDIKDFLDVPSSYVPAFGGAFKFGTKYQASYGLDASQLLFSGDYLVGLQASKVYADLSTKATQRTKIETAATVSKAYYTVLINNARVNLLDANIVRIKAAMGGAEGLYKYGFAEKLDYDRLVVTHNNLLIEKEKIERLVLLSNYLLKYQMGMDIQQNITLTDKLEDVKFDIADNVSAEKFDYSKRIEYNLFETQYKLAALDLKKSKFAYIPNAAAYASLTKNGFSQNNLGQSFDLFDSKKNPKTGDMQPFYKHWYPSSIIGAKVTMPIFTGLQRNAKTQQAKLNLQKAENNIENLKKGIDLEIISSITTLKNASVSLENQKKNIALAEEVYKTTKIKFEQGVGTNLEMVTAESALKESQTNYLSALYDAIIAKIDFDKANGNLK